VRCSRRPPTTLCPRPHTHTHPLPQLDGLFADVRGDVVRLLGALHARSAELLESERAKTVVQAAAGTNPTSVAEAAVGAPAVSAGNPFAVSAVTTAMHAAAEQARASGKAAPSGIAAKYDWIAAVGAGLAAAGESASAEVRAWRASCFSAAAGLLHPLLNAPPRAGLNAARRCPRGGPPARPCGYAAASRPRPRLLSTRARPGEWRATVVWLSGAERRWSERRSFTRQWKHSLCPPPLQVPCIVCREPHASRHCSQVLTMLSWLASALEALGDPCHPSRAEFAGLVVEANLGLDKLPSGDAAGSGSTHHHRGGGAAGSRHGAGSSALQRCEQIDAAGAAVVEATPYAILRSRAAEMHTVAAAAACSSGASPLISQVSAARFYLTRTSPSSFSSWQLCAATSAPTVCPALCRP
jgi:hypothetical protein